MGNQAIIKPVDSTMSLYLHWNGGRDSVEAFLKYCELKGYRGFGQDTGYGLARLAQVVGNFFGGSTSVGTCLCEGTKDDADMIDNGIYIVKGWKIIDRVFHGCEQHQYKLEDMLKDIDDAQPKDEQLGDFITAVNADIKTLSVGDEVITRDCVTDKIEKHKVVGIGINGRRVNGTDVGGVPYIDKYGLMYGDCSDNINNYLRPGEVWINPNKGVEDAKEDSEDE